MKQDGRGEGREREAIAGRRNSDASKVTVQVACMIKIDEKIKYTISWKLDLIAVVGRIHSTCGEQFLLLVVRCVSIISSGPNRTHEESPIDLVSRAQQFYCFPS